jgi:hypothetical protein
MSFKSKLLAGAATLALVAGVGTAGTLSASAATPSCGPGFVDPTTGILSGCVDIFSRQFGTHRSPNFVLDVYRQGANVGQPIILFRTSNSDPAEDFTVSLQGAVSDFFAAGLVSAAVNLHYGDMPAYELEYAPFGVDTGLCVGVATTAVQNEGVTLQPCGVSAKTVWIDDTIDSPATFNRGYDPVINGSDTNFSHPFVLSYPKNGFPTDRPRPQLRVQNLTGFSNGSGPIVGTVPDYQLWGADLGVLR